MQQYQMSERHACRLIGLARSTHRYRERKAGRDVELRQRLKELAAKRMRFGYRRATAAAGAQSSQGLKDLSRLLAQLNDATFGLVS
jgi:hypothetical protein